LKWSSKSRWRDSSLFRVKLQFIQHDMQWEGNAWKRLKTAPIFAPPVALARRNEVADW
jgi:hypothetical protein